MNRKTIVRALLVWLAASLLGTSFANERVKFLHDWRWEGPAGPLLLAVAKGYFKDEKLDVTFEPGTGSGATVTRVAAGDFDLGFGDFSALIEYAANNAGATPPQAIYMVYERTPAAVFALTSSGIRSPKDLAGVQLAAPAFDGGRKLWPAFADNARLSGTSWKNVDARERESQLAKGQVKAITGFYFTSLLNLEAQGLSGTEITVIPFYEAGVRAYGNAIVGNAKFLRERPKVAAAFLRAYNRALKESYRNPEEAAKYVKAMQPEANERLEWRRLRLALDNFVMTPTARAEGLGSMSRARVEQNINLVVTSFKLASTPKPEALFSDAFLPSAAERRVE
jgi:NitT/TauT family transport system substrate-binding protein